jgi:glycosyltransferase involved in cell wall biosynthesis
MLRLAVNCLSINSTSALGVRTFLLSQLKGLPSFADSLPEGLDVEFHVQRESLLAPAIRATVGHGGNARIRIVEVAGITSPLRRIAYEQFVLPWRAIGCDVVCSINNANPLFLFGRARSIVTIHDLLPFVEGSRYKGVHQAYLRVLTRLCARRARTVITVSEHSKAELRARLALEPARIQVVYNCLEAPFRAADPSDMRFFLVLGGLNSDKRVDVALKGFRQFADACVDSRHELIVAGPDQGSRADLEHLAAELGLAARVRFLGQVAEAEKTRLIAGCSGLIMMGRSEGFGIPVLEAMRVGRPSLVANAGALPEIAGRSGIVVEPEPQQVAAGLQKLARCDFDWAALCETEYARFRPADSARHFWQTLASA